MERRSDGPSTAPLEPHVLAVAAVVVLGGLMTILDTTIVPVAIATLSRSLRADLSTIQWVSTGYLLALATVIPLTGWAADRFGTRRLWMASVALFAGGSAMCALAWSAQSLIAFRVLQGLGGGMVMPAGMTILAQAAGPERMGRAMSIVGVPMLLGPILGPVLGGLLVDAASWPWIFVVNVPVAVVALTLGRRILDRGAARPGEPLDVRGFALLAPGLALVVYGLAQTGAAGGVRLGDALLVVGGLALVALFVRHALRVERPLLDVRLFHAPAFSSATGVGVLFAAAMYGTMLLLPLYLQVVRGETPLAAGILLVPQGVGAAMAMPVAGRLVDRVGAGRVVLGGLPLVASGLTVFALLDADTSYALIAAALWLVGVGAGCTMMPAMSAAYATLAHPAVPRATTALNIVQRIGGSLGTALLAVALQHELTRALHQVPGTASQVPGTGGGGLEAVRAVPPGARAGLAGPLADAFATTFRWPVLLALLALAPALVLPRRRRATTAPAAAPAAE